MFITLAFVCCVAARTRLRNGLCVRVETRDLGNYRGPIIHGGTLVKTVSPYSEAKENLKGQTLNTFATLAADSKAIERALKSIFFVNERDLENELENSLNQS